MKLYKDQLSTTMTLSEFIQEMNFDLAFHALEALRAYDGFKPEIEYDDYLIFYVGNNVWAITKIIDQWQPIEVNDRVRKFTAYEVWEYDSYANIRFI